MAQALGFMAWSTSHMGSYLEKGHYHVRLWAHPLVNLWDTLGAVSAGQSLDLAWVQIWILLFFYLCSLGQAVSLSKFKFNGEITGAKSTRKREGFFLGRIRGYPPFQDIETSTGHWHCLWRPMVAGRSFITRACLSVVACELQKAEIYNKLGLPAAQLWDRGIASMQWFFL